MKPLKGIVPISMWLMRIALLLFVYVSFFDTVKALSFKTLNFYIAAAYVVFSLLLFVGGFIKSGTLTVLSALFLFLVSVYKIVDIADAGISVSFAVYGLIATIALFFMSAGNKA